MSTTRILCLLLALNLAQGILYSSVIPLWQNPDEHWHFEYAELLKLNIPKETPDDGLRRVISQSLVEHKFWEYQNISLETISPESRAFMLNRAFFHPPGYYVLCALVLKTLRIDTIEMEAYALRFFSVILATLVVYLGYCVVKELFPEDFFLRVGVPMFIVFLPQYTFRSSGITNDKLAEVLFSLIFLLLVKGTKRHLTPLFSFSIIAVVVAGVFTKKTLLATIPLVLLFFILHFGQGKPAKKYLLKVALLLLIGVSLLLALYIWKPDIFGSMTEYTGQIPPYTPRTGVEIVQEIESIPFKLGAYMVYLYDLVGGFWARFGWLDIVLSDFWYTLLLIVDAIALVGLGLYGGKLFTRQITLTLWQKKGLVFLAIGTILVCLQTFIRDNILTHFFPHGRMLFVAIVPISLFFMLGMREIVRAFDERRALFLLGLLMAGFDAMCLFSYILPYYYGIFC